MILPSAPPMRHRECNMRGVNAHFHSAAAAGRSNATASRRCLTAGLRRLSLCQFSLAQDWSRRAVSYIVAKIPYGHDAED
jgi:hypothetical protein